MTGLLIGLLAGGEGSRIGGNKPQRLLQGRTLAEHALARAAGWPGELRMLIREPAQTGSHDIACLRDDPEIAGPLAGLSAALHHAELSGFDEVLTIPCDMPFMPDNLPKRLGEGLAAAMAAVAASGGRLHPVCALWRVEALAQLDPYLATGRRSLHGFAESIGFAAVEWDAEPFDPFFNVNSEADLQVAEELAA